MQLQRDLTAIRYHANPVETIRMPLTWLLHHLQIPHNARITKMVSTVEKHLQRICRLTR